MLEAAAEHRYAYYAITDHAPDLAMQRMTDEKMLAQRVQVAKLQERYPKMRLLHGTELNIGPDGSVDWDEEFLSGFDVTVASVHSHFNQSREEMTRARGPCDREPFRQHHRPPHHSQDRSSGTRSTSTWRRCSRRRRARAQRWRSTPTPIASICETSTCCGRAATGSSSRSTPTAHAVGHLDVMRFGVATAQRGWLTKDDVINAWPITKLERFLRKGRPKAAAR